jgi:mono/diheme cytochrome c family protein
LLRSRWRVLLIAISLLLLLDLGRSMYARVGYAKPTEVWQPDPAVYADLTWPPGADLPPDTPVGERIYAQRCAVCHGPDGRGNGPAAPSLIPRPRDFTLGDFKYKSTPPGQPPTDADLVNIVAQGLQDSAMPYWRDLLSDEETSAVVAYIKGLSPVFQGTAPEAIVVPPRVRPDEVSIARGRKLFVAQGCVACHGPDGRGGTMLTDAKGYPVMARDLTAPWTFRGGSDPEAIWLRLTTGLSPGPMPSYADRTTPEQR